MAQEKTTKVHVTIATEGKSHLLTLTVPTENADDALQWVTTKLTEKYAFSAGHN